MDDEQQQAAGPRATGYTWVYIFALVLSLAIFGGGVYLAATKYEYAVVAAGGVCLVVTMLAWPIALGAAAASRATDRAIESRLAPAIYRFDQIIATLTLMSEQQLISDRAKQIAFREKDRDAFRRAIEEDLTKHDYDAASGLVDEMEQEFGGRGEVERLRAEVNARRDDSVRRRLDAAIAVVERHIEAEQWPAAFKEAERLKKVFPDQVRVQLLDSDLEQRRLGVKRTLLARWQDHVRTKSVDDAIFVLRKLDNYLTPVEASGLEEDARMIFKEKLARLRVDFTAAVQGHHWREAKKLAEVVMSDFPNTQMASEVRGMMPTLEERLRELQASGGLQTMAS